MDRKTFLLSLIAAIRTKGICDLANDPEAITAGVKAAMQVEDCPQIEGPKPNGSTGFARIFVATGVRYDLLTMTSPGYDRLSIDLPDRDAAIEYLSDIIPPDKRNGMLKMADAFIAAFREKAGENQAQTMDSATHP